jgi:hypothetical protein
MGGVSSAIGLALVGAMLVACSDHPAEPATAIAEAPLSTVKIEVPAFADVHFTGELEMLAMLQQGAKAPELVAVTVLDRSTGASKEVTFGFKYSSAGIAHYFGEMRGICDFKTQSQGCRFVGVAVRACFFALRDVVDAGVYDPEEMSGGIRKCPADWQQAL